MSRGHWLDPLARKLLQAVGDLPPDPPVRPPGRNGASQAQPLEPTRVIDVNRARAEDWQLLPGCSDSMIDLLLRLQRGGVQFSQADDLFQLLELPSLQAEEWRPHLIFRWHGDAPPLEDNRALDFNAASHQELQQRLQWPETRFNRLCNPGRLCVALVGELMNQRRDAVLRIFSTIAAAQRLFDTYFACILREFKSALSPEFPFVFVKRSSVIISTKL